MQNTRRLALALVAAVTATFALGSAVAQGVYPNKQINLIVAFPPGGDTDALARLFAEKLSTRLGQPVIVENKTGASGTIGNSYVAKANPDGYTLLFTPNTMATAPLVLKPGTGATYDPLTDFTPIFLAGTQSLFLVTTAASGVTNMSELVAAAKAGKVVNYASPGAGSPMHILGEMFNKSAGVKISPIAYRGSGPAIVDLLGGHLPMMYTTLGPVSQHLASGKLVNIGVADAKRSPLQPNVPTLTESGFKDSEVGAWQGFVGPKGLSPKIVRTLNGHLNEIIKAPDVATRMTALALVPAGGEPAEIARMTATDFSRYGKIIKEAGIQAD